MRHWLATLWAWLKHPFRCRTCAKRWALELLRQGATEKARKALASRGTTASAEPMYLWFTPDGEPAIRNGTPPPAHQRPRELVGADLVLDVGRVSGTVRRA